MTKEIRTVLVVVLVLLGLGLMVGGVIVDKNGAVVVGICVAAVAAQQWIVIRKRTGQDDK
jgi:type IV secretory pathway VirB2 component (pilin)